jgi:DNA-binding NarL/FixJ family response regulator
MAGHTERRPIEPLTPREQEVLELLRLGLTNREIAQRLGISTDGVKYHVSSILGKLGVRNRYEAAVWPERRPWW